MKKTVKFTLDATNNPTLTNAQKAELKALSNMPDADIDFSDIPMSPSEIWKNAVSNLRIPEQTGHAFHGKLDTDSTANWTVK